MAFHDICHLYLPFCPSISEYNIALANEKKLRGLSTQLKREVQLINRCFSTWCLFSTGFCSSDSKSKNRRHSFSVKFGILFALDSMFVCRFQLGCLLRHKLAAVFHVLLCPWPPRVLSGIKASTVKCFHFFLKKLQHCICLFLLLIDTHCPLTYIDTFPATLFRKTSVDVTINSEENTLLSWLRPFTT